MTRHPLPDTPQRGRTQLHISIEQDPAAADIGVIERGLFAFEEGRLGPPEHAQFAVMLRDRMGVVKGGLDGHIMWRRLFIKTFWLPEALRGQGYGSQLLVEAEAEARLRGCAGIWLTALGDRAKNFYTMRGYGVFGRLPGYVEGQDLFSLAKDLT
ncbi:MAG TPA: GNAT family N-acetyltransferase [Stellaceae bacterium]|nr:GNAT family N-acetyltransferase [Stellaceae bacterium]